MARPVWEPATCFGRVGQAGSSRRIVVIQGFEVTAQKDRQRLTEEVVLEMN